MDLETIREPLTIQGFHGQPDLNVSMTQGRLVLNPPLDATRHGPAVSGVGLAGSILRSDL
jgi:hypothetical protein